MVAVVGQTHQEMLRLQLILVGQELLEPQTLFLEPHTHGLGVVVVLGIKQVTEVMAGLAVVAAGGSVQLLAELLVLAVLV